MHSDWNRETDKTDCSDRNEKCKRKCKRARIRVGAQINIVKYTAKVKSSERSTRSGRRKEEKGNKTIIWNNLLFVF